MDPAEGDVDFSIHGQKAELTASTNTFIQYPFGEVQGGNIKLTVLMKHTILELILAAPNTRRLIETLESMYLRMNYLRKPTVVFFFAALLSSETHHMSGLVLKKSDSKTFRRLGAFRANTSSEVLFSHGSQIYNGYCDC